MVKMIRIEITSEYLAECLGLPAGMRIKQIRRLEGMIVDAPVTFEILVQKDDLPDIDRGGVNRATIKIDWDWNLTDGEK